MPDLTLPCFTITLGEWTGFSSLIFVKTGTNHELGSASPVWFFEHDQILYSAEGVFPGNYAELFLTVAQNHSPSKGVVFHKMEKGGNLMNRNMDFEKN